MSALNRRSLIVSASSLPALAIPTASLAAPANPLDRQAIIGRAEQIVEILRGRFVCAGWHEKFDTNRAAAFLEAVRQEDYNADYRDEAGQFVDTWMIDHGQSFDWLYHGNPAGLIAGAAHRAFPALPTVSDAESRLLELERQAAAAEAAAVEAGRPHTEAEKAMFAWERQNPRPKPREVSTLKETMQLVQSSIDEKEGQITTSAAAEKRSQARSLITKKMADVDREHAEALKSWEVKHGIARANCHYEEREALYQRLLDEADAIRDEAAAIPANTIEGLRCKARMLTEADLSCMYGGLLAESIINDLLTATDRQKPSLTSALPAFGNIEGVAS